MRHPVLIRPSGVHIERDTIELWMSSHGSVCPISMMPIDRERDLEPAKELQNRYTNSPDKHPFNLTHVFIL